MTTTSDEVSALIRAQFAQFPGQFRPSAFFDDRLDCIRVIVKDCSVLETRINELITVLKDRYASDNDPTPYVGFTVKGARHFCHDNNLSLDAPIQVSALLDAMLKSFPSS